jgi:hypothetical protein
MCQVFEYAMLCEMFEMQRNPMDLLLPYYLNAVQCDYIIPAGKRAVWA